jgi:NAD(P)-dependent dehydrogenase (short-subunit alcohol dehydrogenase family)
MSFIVHPNPMRGRVALVTGAGSGVGRASALAFAAAGARVVVSDIAAQHGEETVRLIHDAHGEALFLRADVSRAIEVAALIRDTIEWHGRLDYAHNNAGIITLGDIVDCTEEDWDRVMAVNLKGVWLCLKYEIPQMVAQGGGAIVNTASIAGIKSTAGSAAYSASKHGVMSLTKSAARQYAGAGVRVNAVCPGSLETPMTDFIFAQDPGGKEQAAAGYPMGRLGTPEEIAAAVLWLCSDAASFVTGHPLIVDGGRLL